MNKNVKRERGIVQADYMGKDKFANKIVCGSCNQSYVVTGTKPYKYYMCRTKKNHGKERCGNNNLLVERLEEYLHKQCSGLYFLQVQMFKALNIKELRNIQEQIHQRMDAGVNTEEINRLYDEYKTLKSKSGKLVRMHLEDMITTDQFIEMNGEIKVKMEGLDCAIKEKTKTKGELYSEFNEIEQCIKRLQELEFKKTFTEEEMLEEIEQIVAYNNGEDITLAYTYKVLNTIAKVTQKYGIEVKIDIGQRVGAIA